MYKKDINNCLSTKQHLYPPDDDCYTKNSIRQSENKKKAGILKPRLLMNQRGCAYFDTPSLRSQKVVSFWDYRTIKRIEKTD